MKKIDLTKPLLSGGEAKGFQDFLIGLGLGKDRMPGSKIGKILAINDDTNEKLALARLPVFGKASPVSKLNTIQSDSGIHVKVGYAMSKKTIEVPTLNGCFKMLIDYTVCLDNIPKEFHKQAVQMFAFEVGIPYEEPVKEPAKKRNIFASLRLYAKDVNKHLNSL